MAKVKPRVKVPKKAAAGEVLEIKALISHPMHTGLAKDKKGNKIPRKIINRFTVSYNNEKFFDMEMEPSISANPFVVFPFKMEQAGTMTFVWHEDGGEQYSLEKKIALG